MRSEEMGGKQEGVVTREALINDLESTSQAYDELKIAHAEYEVQMLQLEQRLKGGEWTTEDLTAYQELHENQQNLQRGMANCVELLNEAKSKSDLLLAGLRI